MLQDLGLLTGRLATGGLLMGHGSQKLFGWFGGGGLQGTAGWLETMGLRPGNRWAMLAGLGEFGGGLLTALGLLHPVGPITTIGPMAVATGTAHRGKPIWVSSGGAELPVTNMAIALMLIMTGPGRFSLDRALGIRTPLLLTALATASVAAGTAFALTQPMPSPESPQVEVAAADLQAGEGGGESEPL